MLEISFSSLARTIYTIKRGGRQLLERELLERQLRDDSWAIRQLLATKIGRYVNWSCRVNSVLSTVSNKLELRSYLKLFIIITD